MTTSVTVKTCSWPVRVWTAPCKDGETIDGADWGNAVDVPPNSERTFYVHSTMDLCVRELPLPDRAE